MTMCGCDFNFTCPQCEQRRLVDLGEPDERERDQERREAEMGRADFERPVWSAN